MSAEVTDIKTAVSDYLKQEFLSEDDLSNFNDDTPLMSSGVLDSISTLQLVDFIEKKFGVEFAPHEVDQDNLDTLNMIGDFVKGKM